MEKLIIQKNRITTDQLIDALAFSLCKLQKCKKCNMYAHQDDIKFLHPLIGSVEGDRFMCSQCYNENIVVIDILPRKLNN